MSENAFFYGGSAIYPPIDKPQRDPARMQRIKLLMNKLDKRFYTLRRLLELAQRGDTISNTHLLMALADLEAVVQVMTGDAVDIEDF